MKPSKPAVRSPSGRVGPLTILATLVALGVSNAYTQSGPLRPDAPIADVVSLADRQAESGAAMGQALSSNPTALGTTIVALQTRVGDLEIRLAEAERTLSRLGGGASQDNTQQASSTLVAPFTVIDEDGRVLFKVSRQDDRSTAYVVSTNGNVAALTADSETAATVATSGGPNGAMVVVGTRDSQAGGLRVKIAGTNRLSAGLFKDHDGLTGLEIRNASGQKKTRLGNVDKVAVLNLQSDGGGPSTGIRMSARPDDSNIDMANEDAFVAGLRGSAEGGSVIVSGANGGYTAAKLGVGEAGGFLHVFGQSGGNARASVRGDGLLAVMAPNGNIVGNMHADHKDAGYLSIGDSGGNVLGEMAVSRQSGVGYLKLGPGDGGLAQSINGIGRQASSLVGRRTSN